jgi:hypothetical protein
MAAPSLKDVLAAVPAAKLDSYNELLPGLQADKKNLSTLLEYIKKEDGIRSTAPDGAHPTVSILPHKQRKRPFITVAVWGPLQTWGHRAVQERARPCVARTEVKACEDGLLEGLCFAKEGLKRFREEGTCPDCASGPDEYPRKRLKAVGMPKCEECVIKAVLQ